jgi:hypothetical protein
MRWWRLRGRGGSVPATGSLRRSSGLSLRKSGCADVACAGTCGNLTTAEGTWKRWPTMLELPLSASSGVMARAIRASNESRKSRGAVGEQLHAQSGSSIGCAVCDTGGAFRRRPGSMNAARKCG